MNDELISGLEKLMLSDEGKSDHINYVGNELITALNTLAKMLAYYGEQAEPLELLQLNCAIGDALELLETIDPLEKFKNTGLIVRVGALH